MTPARHRSPSPGLRHHYLTLGPPPIRVVPAVVATAGLAALTAALVAAAAVNGWWLLAAPMFAAGLFATLLARDTAHYRIGQHVARRTDRDLTALADVVRDDAPTEELPRLGLAFLATGGAR